MREALRPDGRPGVACYSEEGTLPVPADPSLDCSSPFGLPRVTFPGGAAVIVMTEQSKTAPRRDGRASGAADRRRIRIPGL
jgi:hypothetical protein